MLHEGDNLTIDALVGKNRQLTTERDNLRRELDARNTVDRDYLERAAKALIGNHTITRLIRNTMLEIFQEDFLRETSGVFKESEVFEKLVKDEVRHVLWELGESFELRED